MGTNYYHHLDVCEHCGRGDKPVHIGKSSAGWCFSLHVGDDAPDDLEGWKARWWVKGGVIKDEYGTVVSVERMIERITERSSPNSWDNPARWRYSDGEATFHHQNDSERGPNNLLRRRIGRHCVGHGAGTWDLIPGEFS